MPYRRTTTKRAPARSMYPPVQRYGGQGAYKRYTVPYRRAYGKGAYNVDNGPWANRGASVGGFIGGHYGGPVGKAVGSWLGRRAFHYPAKLFGSGSYDQVSGGEVVPGQTARNIAPQVPTFTGATKDDSVVISHREYLGDIITSSTPGAFNIQSFALNPSETNSFPWLSNIVQPNYQQYKFDGLIFEFKSFSADALNSTNTALGSVFSCINYDYTDADLASRYEVENTDWSASCKPSEDMLIPVECKPRQTSLGGLLYVINGNTVPTNADPKMYYLGKMWIGTTGFQGTSVNIGSLYVTYKIRLYKPVMTRPLSNALIFSQARSTVDASNLWGTTTFASTSNCDSIGVSISGNVLTMSRARLVIGQRFMMVLYITGSVAGTVNYPTITHSGGTSYNSFDGYGLPTAASPPNGSASTKMLMVNTFTVTNNSQDLTITLGGATGLPIGTTFSQVNISQVCGIPYNQIGQYVP